MVWFDPDLGQLGLSPEIKDCLWVLDSVDGYATRATDGLVVIYPHICVSLSSSCVFERGFGKGGEDVGCVAYVKLSAYYTPNFKTI